MGVFEMAPFAEGTRALAQAITEVDGAHRRRRWRLGRRVRQLGFDEKAFGHISTGGGASLELLEGKELPGLSCTGGVTMARTPLMAGNWKMNLNHLEAIALVQKLAFSLNDNDFDAVEVAVLPPFTDIRSVQTLVDGDKYRITTAPRTCRAHDAGAYTGEIVGAMLAKLGCSYVSSATRSGGQYHHEDDALVNAKVKAAVRTSSRRSCASASARGRRQAATSSTPRRSSTAPSALSPTRRAPGRRLRAGVGDRHGEVATPRTRRRSAPRSAPGWPSSIRRPGRRRARALRRLGEGVQRRRDHGPDRRRRRPGRRREHRRRGVRRASCRYRTAAAS
jgi:triosephosphate isomerase